MASAVVEVAPREKNPYVGPRPFERKDMQVFFGREREIRELLSLVIANRVVLVYAASGAGKTSLLNARLAPLLEQEEQFEVLPPARIRDFVVDRDRLSDVRNVFAFGVLLNWTRDQTDGNIAAGNPERMAAELSLPDFLRMREHPTDLDGLPAPRAAIFDQFEELFTAYPEYWQQREGFVRQIATALEEDQLLRVVIATREDHVAELDEFAPLLPGTLRARFRLEPLGRKAALAAVASPLRDTRRSFSPKAAERLVADLLTLRVDDGRGGTREIEGRFVEPVQLQVVCQSLWSELPPDVTEISEEDLRVFGDVDQVLRQFYDEAVASAAAAARTDETRLRGLIEKTFITSMGTRGTVYRQPGSTGVIPNEAIDELESRRLIRGERRAGARWFELTHDRLIKPILASNKRHGEVQAARRRGRRLIAATVAGFVIAVLTIVPIVLWREQVDKPKGVFLGHTDLVTSAVLSPDGRQVLTASFDGTVRLWDAASRRQSRERQLPGPIRMAIHSPDGRLIATAGDDGTRLLDAATLKMRSFLRAKKNAYVYTVMFSADGQSLVTSSEDGTARVLRVPDLKERRVLRSRRGPLYTASFIRNHELVAGGGEAGVVQIWELPSGKLIRELRGHTKLVQTVAASPNGELLVSTSNDRTTRLWEFATGKPPTVLRHHTGEVYFASFSANGSLLATASEDGTARIWQITPLKSDPLTVLRGHTGAVVSAVFSPDGQRILTASADATARIQSWR